MSIKIRQVLPVAGIQGAPMMLAPPMLEHVYAEAKNLYSELSKEKKH